MQEMNWVQRGLLQRLEAERGLGVEWTDEEIREHNAEKGWDILTADRSTTQHVMLFAHELAAVISAYHRPGQLVLRFVDHCDKGDWHICWADWRFTDGAIVTLEALCGEWCYGTLTRESWEGFRRRNPQAGAAAGTLCPTCTSKYQDSIEADEDIPF